MNANEFELQEGRRLSIISLPSRMTGAQTSCPLDSFVFKSRELSFPRVHLSIEKIDQQTPSLR